VLIFAYLNRQQVDADILFAYAMLSLTFPGGLLVAAVFAVLGLFGIDAPGGFIGSLIAWPLFVCVGYAQWFILVPRLVRWVRSPTRR